MIYNQVNCFYWEAGCRIDWSIIAAWAQAILSAFAIWWAGKIARAQLKNQLEIDRVKREKEEMDSQINIANVFLGIVEMIKDVFKQFQEQSTEAHNLGVEMRKHVKDDFTHLFQDLFEDTSKLSIYDLRTQNLTKLFIGIRMNLRRVQFNCHVYFKSPIVYKVSDFLELDEAVKKGITEIAEFEVYIKEEIAEIQKNGIT